MGAPAEGSVVLVRFPFSDLTASKLRPAVVLAQVHHEDLILCQVTSNPYADPLAIEVSEDAFEKGSLQRTSYIRPDKLFTANEALIEAEIANLKGEIFNDIIDAIVGLLHARRKQ